jgi:hypothetical protein
MCGISCVCVFLSLSLSYRLVTDALHGLLAHGAVLDSGLFLDLLAEIGLFRRKAVKLVDFPVLPLAFR